MNEDHAEIRVLKVRLDTHEDRIKNLSEHDSAIFALLREMKDEQGKMATDIAVIRGRKFCSAPDACLVLKDEVKELKADIASLVLTRASGMSIGKAATILGSAMVGLMVIAASAVAVWEFFFKHHDAIPKQ